uniref:Beta-1,4-galactosyltransferase 6 n=1 Tax=Schistocephalus solidus TaxID=70667 RepID=A0A0X3Q795_SCHSO
MHCTMVSARCFFFRSVVIVSALVFMFFVWLRKPVHLSKTTSLPPGFDCRFYTPSVPHHSQNGHLSDLNAELLKQLGPPNRTVAKDTVAIILPYRNRYLELFNFLLRMHVFLRKQTVQYVMLVVEQSGSEFFNRAKLFNAAVREIRGSSLGDPLREIDCFILHDVDKVPISNSTIYNCGPAVRQMVTSFKTESEFVP